MFVIGCFSLVGLALFRTHYCNVTIEQQFALRARRKSPEVTEVLPLLCLHGLSTKDFVPALEGFFGSPAGLSASAVGATLVPRSPVSERVETIEQRSAAPGVDPRWPGNPSISGYFANIPPTDFPPQGTAEGAKDPAGVPESPAQRSGAVIQPPSQGGDTGSNPVGAALLKDQVNGHI